MRQILATDVQLDVRAGRHPRDGKRWEPQQRLVQALLERALLDAKSRTRYAAEAREWIFSEPVRTIDWRFSFERVCEVLFLDAEYLREEVRMALAGGADLLVRRVGEPMGRPPRPRVAA